jgi:hypothetical protein
MNRRVFVVVNLSDPIYSGIDFDLTLILIVSYCMS